MSSKAEEVKLQRGGEKGEAGERTESPWRNRPIEESIKEFRKMRDGHYKPKEAQLRMKQDIKNGNPQMWDLSAYRVLNATHHRTGDKWKIYPTYDFTHCLVDSMENISHSLCTTEFINSRESYDWLCDALAVYRPQQSEYGRLSIDGTILSKRKIAKLVVDKKVRGWDDPRLFTLVGLRRRGVPPGAILSFVSELGVTTSVSTIQASRFEKSVRNYLEATVPRLMMVLDPIPVIIENLPDDFIEEIDIPFMPKGPDYGSHKVPFTKTVYIDRTDFREVDDPDYYRLAPGKSVGLLKVPYPIKATGFSKDTMSGNILEVRAIYEKPEGDSTAFAKPKAYISWVSAKSPIRAEVRCFNNIFIEPTADNPEGINPKSEEIFNAVVETGLDEIERRAPWPEQEGEGKEGIVGKESVRFQATRVGYFAMDSDSKPGKMVLNRIVTLKEDKGK
jgi:glutaminyl-tRNA synthetase